MLKVINRTKTNEGYCEILYKSGKRYYRIRRTYKGNMYDIYVNDSEYGEPKYDREMYYKNRKVREYTIAECKESIKVYDMF